MSASDRAEQHAERLELAELIGDAVAARMRVMASARGLTVAQEAFRPTPKDWTIPQVLEHLVLATQAGINATWRAAQGVRNGQNAWQGEHVNRGLPIEEVIARTWPLTERGRLTWKTSLDAPNNAVPSAGGPIDFWRASLLSLQPLLEQFAEALAGLDLEQVVYPHPVSGSMDARQRVAFFRWHFDHHLQQIEDIKAAPGFPNT